MTLFLFSPKKEKEKNHCFDHLSKLLICIPHYQLDHRHQHLEPCCYPLFFPNDTALHYVSPNFPSKED